MAVYQDRVRDLTLRLCAIPSVNGTQGEADLLDAAHQLLAGVTAGAGELRIFRGPDRRGRPAFVLAHLRGTGPRAVLQFGHVDTVGVADFGPLRHLAFDPVALTRRVADGALGQELAVLAQSGAWLFGRGTLDMKAGLAASLAVLERFARRGERGHLLVAFTSDEEAGSHGIHALTEFLGPYLEAEGLELVGIVNTDATGPRPGLAGPRDRFAYAGSVGKLLPCAYVRGVPSHVGEPETGLDPDVVLAELTRRVVYAERLRDGAGHERTAHPVSLGARDDKGSYDVQTPLSATGCYNVLYVERSPGDVLTALHGIAEEAVAAAQATLRAAFGQAPEIRVYTFAELLARARAQGIPFDAARALGAAGETTGPAPRIRAVQDLADAVLGREPAVVLFVGSALIPKVASAGAGLAALQGVLARHAARSGNVYHLGRFFPLISDLSFVARSPDWQDPAIPANDPLGGLADRPTGPALACDAVFMVGPHGEGAHRVDERLFVPYSFEDVPELLTDLTEALWHPAEPAP